MQSVNLICELLSYCNKMNMQHRSARGEEGRTGGAAANGARGRKNVGQKCAKSERRGPQMQKMHLKPKLRKNFPLTGDLA